MEFAHQCLVRTFCKNQLQHMTTFWFRFNCCSVVLMHAHLVNSSLPLSVKKGRSQRNERHCTFPHLLRRKKKSHRHVKVKMPSVVRSGILNIFDFPPPPPLFAKSLVVCPLSMHLKRRRKKKMPHHLHVLVCVLRSERSIQTIRGDFIATDASVSI